ncbi:MAG: hypothetical protein ACRDSH_07145, partial [Pseudonocardiaceae bacterium]
NRQLQDVALHAHRLPPPTSNLHDRLQCDSLTSLLHAEFPISLVVDLADLLAAAYREPDYRAEDEHNDDDDQDGLPDTREETPGFELGGEQASVCREEEHGARL